MNKNLRLRFLTGFAGVAVVTSAILYSEWTALFVLGFIAIMSQVEFYKLSKSHGIHPQKEFGILISFVILVPSLLNALNIYAPNLFPLLIILPFVVFIRELYRKHNQPVTNIAYTVLAVIYTVVPFFLMYLIAFEGEGDVYKGSVILGYFIILWASDTGAYFTGRAIGRTKFFERHSPKKTWEGFAGGAVLALLAAWGVSRFVDSFGTADWLVMGAIIVVTGALGDLVESMFKRSIGVKDSGSMLPGHGGFLDRFDGVFVSVPFVFVYLISR